MESLVYFIISHSQMVLITLVGTIILCVFGLLLISFHHPQDAVANEVGNVDRIEGVLRQILSEQDWPSAKVAAGTPAPMPAVESVLDPLPPAVPPTEGAEAAVDSVVSPVDAAAATAPVAETIATAAETNIAAPQEAVAPAAVVAPAVTEVPADDPALANKIKELEEKLAEYSVIEEDIADLSRFRQENDDLKKKLTHATGVSAEEATRMPWDDFEKVVKEKNTAPAAIAVATTIDKPAE